MPGSVLGPGLVLLVVGLVLPTDDFRAVLIAGLMLVACVFLIRAVVHVGRHLRLPAPGRSTGEAAPRPGLPALRPMDSADVSGTPTPLTSAGSAPEWQAA